MYDLVFTYENENGDVITAKYNSIFDFTEDMESEKEDIPMMDYENVEADFFEKPSSHKHFDTIADLYEHCKEIMK